MEDHVLREADTGEAIVDNDGVALRELDVDAVDEVDDHGATIQQLAAGERAWRFGHVIVDEAQDLTPMQWRMITRRARGGSMTVVGDLAQRSIGEPGTWRDHLPDSIDSFDYRELTINYRSPSEINELASQVLDALAPELAHPEAIRQAGHAPRSVTVDHDRSHLAEIVAAERAALDGGTMAVIGVDLDSWVPPAQRHTPDVAWITPWQAKGLEFDSVVLVDPAAMAGLPRGLSLLYVAITRSTDRLTVVHRHDLPELLASLLP